jgi:hypothetical protein
MVVTAYITLAAQAKLAILSRFAAAICRASL